MLYQHSTFSNILYDAIGWKFDFLVYANFVTHILTWFLSDGRDIVVYS